MNILTIKGITKYFGNHCILNDINLEIAKPTILALVAPNGTGKSTLLNIITNIERPNEGQIQIFDKKNTDPMIFEHVTYLQDNSVLYPDLTGRDHLEFIKTVHNLSNNQVKLLVEQLEMSHYLNKKVKKYSLGMKQHLLFAMAVLPKPKLIILDEPLNGLDPSSILNVRTILKTLYQNGSTILFSSHNLDEIDRLTDNILFLHEGELISSIDYHDLKLEYTFVLESIEKVTKRFQDLALVYEKNGKKKLTVSLSAEEYRTFLAFCQEKEIEIHDSFISQEITQNIYFELFRGNYHDHN